MTTFTIRLDAQDAVASAALRTVLASVPARFRVTTEQDADVVVLAGVQPDWTRRLATAIAAGIRGVLIVRPGPANSDEVRELARRAAPEATLVGVDVGFAADPPGTPRCPRSRRTRRRPRCSTVWSPSTACRR